METMYILQSARRILQLLSDIAIMHESRIGDLETNLLKINKT